METAINSCPHIQHPASSIQYPIRRLSSYFTTFAEPFQPPGNYQQHPFHSCKKCKIQLYYFTDDHWNILFYLRICYLAQRRPDTLFTNRL